MQIDYTAKRSIQSGHVVDTDYTINVDLSANDRGSSSIGTQNIALSGNTVSVVVRQEIILNLSTVLIGTATTPTINDMREFLDSVKSGEPFQIDSVDYMLNSLNSPYSEIRNADSYFRYSFQVRQL